MAEYTQGISIDGTAYDIPFISIKRNFDVIDKCAERDEETYDLYREIGGVFANFTLSFGTIDDDALYERLIDKLTEPVNFHDFSIPITKGFFEFRGYISQVSDEIEKVLTNTAKFKGLTCKFTMKAPFRRP